jgi:hypothetical protein
MRIELSDRSSGVQLLIKDSDKVLNFLKGSSNYKYGLFKIRSLYFAYWLYIYVFVSYDIQKKKGLYPYAAKKCVLVTKMHVHFCEELNL